MPFAESYDLPEFKAWLVRTLEPMCEADPVVMSDFIIALLKHEAQYTDEQWRDFITTELADFLEDKAGPFVEDLWSTLSTRSFLATPAVSIAPAAAAASQQTAQVAAAAGAASGNGPAVVSSYRPPGSGIPPSGPSRRNGAPTGPGGRGGPASAGRREKCFDYHNRGFCLRGVDCPYEHSEDVIIPSSDMMFPGGMAGGNGRGRGRGGPGGPGPSNHGDRGPQNGHALPQQQPGPDFPFGFPFPMPAFPGMPLQFRPNQPGMIQPDKQSEFWGSTKPPHHTERTSTLVITDIPVAHLTVPAIREYFAQFGEVTNVAVEGRSKRALVTFGSNREAYAAWKSDEAVFGSRHVKVLWHRPRPGQGEAGQKALDASKGLVGNLNKIDSGEGIQGSQSAKLSGPQQRLNATLLELDLKEKRQKRETLMAEQKVLLARTKTADQAAKLEILKRLKEVAKELEDLDKPRAELSEGDVNMDEKSHLDKELEKHGMESVGKRDEEELLKLNAQLSALKEKASSLGVASTPTRFSPYPTRGAYRGRGTPRGRGRGRGGFAGGQFKLDNRSRAIIISGDGLPTAKESVKEWYESYGGNVEDSGEGWKVMFPNRDMAERVLAMGTKDIPKLSGELKVIWDTDAAQNGGGAATQAERDVEMGEDSHRGERDEEE